MQLFEDFYLACISDNSEKVDLMLIEKPELLNKKMGPTESTGLILATIVDKTETIKLLLSKQEVDLSVQNDSGETAIFWASYNNSVDCLKLLLSHPKCSKAIVDMKTLNGTTAEMIAKHNGHTECEKLLKLFDAASIIKELQNSKQKFFFCVDECFNFLISSCREAN